MNKFIKIVLSQDVVCETLAMEYTVESKSSGCIHVNAAQVCYFVTSKMDKTQILKLYVAATGMAANENVSDLIVLEFTKQGMGEYHRIVRNLEEE